MATSVDDARDLADTAFRSIFAAPPEVEVDETRDGLPCLRFGPGLTMWLDGDGWGLDRHYSYVDPGDSEVLIDTETIDTGTARELIGLAVREYADHAWCEVRDQS